MRRAEIIFQPTAAAHMHFMRDEWGPDYFDAIWHLRERCQESRNIERDADRSRIAAVLGALALWGEEKKPEPRKRRLRLVERVRAACL